MVYLTAAEKVSKSSLIIVGLLYLMLFGPQFYAFDRFAIDLGIYAPIFGALVGLRFGRPVLTTMAVCTVLLIPHVSLTEDFMIGLGMDLGLLTLFVCWLAAERVEGIEWIERHKPQKYFWALVVLVAVGLSLDYDWQWFDDTLSVSWYAHAIFLVAFFVFGVWRINAFAAAGLILFVYFCHRAQFFPWSDLFSTPPVDTPSSGEAQGLDSIIVVASKRVSWWGDYRALPLSMGMLTYYLGRVCLDGRSGWQRLQNSRGGVVGLIICAAIFGLRPEILADLDNPFLNSIRIQIFGSWAFVVIASFCGGLVLRWPGVVLMCGALLLTTTLDIVLGQGDFTSVFYEYDILMIAAVYGCFGVFIARYSWRDHKQVERVKRTWPKWMTYVSLSIATALAIAGWENLFGYALAMTYFSFSIAAGVYAWLLRRKLKETNSDLFADGWFATSTALHLVVASVAQLQAMKEALSQLFAAPFLLWQFISDPSMRDFLDVKDLTFVGLLIVAEIVMIFVLIKGVKKVISSVQDIRRDMKMFWKMPKGDRQLFEKLVASAK